MFVQLGQSLRRALSGSPSFLVAAAAATGVHYAHYAAADQTDHEEIIVFTRFPEHGKCKTRLIPTVGADGATELHRKFAENTLMQARGLQLVREALQVSVQFSNGCAEQMRSWLGSGVVYNQQQGADLGSKMANAFANAFDGGAGRVLIVGTDCPGCTAVVLQGALDGLKEADVVFGPALDGGYYLVAARREAQGDIERIFADVQWSTDSVLEKNVTNARECGLKVGLLQPLSDIDEGEDLKHWERALSTGVVKNESRISVVIPAKNEEANIGEAVRLALAKDAADVEVIVVDGGSEDSTRQAAEAAGARVVSNKNFLGRSRQQNYGASLATGDILLFLHADTKLPDGYAQKLRAALCAPSVSAVAFSLGIQDEDSELGLKCIAKLANHRSKSLSLPYGDQGLAMETRVFNGLGGFKDLALMEDYELVLRLSTVGRVLTLNDKVLTSNRRWKDVGPLSSTILNQVIVAGYHLGVRTDTLKGWYYQNVGYLKGTKNADAADGGKAAPTSGETASS